MKETCHHVYGDCAKRGRTGLADRPQNKGPCGAGDVDSRGSSQPFKQTPPPHAKRLREPCAPRQPLRCDGPASTSGAFSMCTHAT